MTDRTARLALPLLHSSQVQKEMTHNEALTCIDMLLHGGVESVGEDTPPAAALPGRCWITGPAPTGAWAGQAGMVAAMTAGGWRFAAPQEGMALWWTGGETTVVFRGGQWRVGEIRGRRVIVDGTAVIGPQRPAITLPATGNIRDIEARSTLDAVLLALREHGLIAK